MDSTFYPLVVFAILWVLFVVVAVTVLAKRQRHRFHTKSHHDARRHYVAGAFSPQMELDLRLPYRRFKKLYPTSGMDYEAYKRLQAQRAFRRSMSSHDNRRMVR